MNRPVRPDWKVKSSVTDFAPHSVGGISSASQEMGWVRTRNVNEGGVHSGGMNVRERDEEYRKFQRNEFIPKDGMVRREKEGGKYGNRAPVPRTATLEAPRVPRAQAAATPFTDTNTVSSTRQPFLSDTIATMTTTTVTRLPVSLNKDVSISPSVPPGGERHLSFSKSPQNDVDPIQFAWPNVFNGKDRKAGTLINEIILGSVWTRYLQQNDDDGVDNATASDEEGEEKGLGIIITDDRMVDGDAVLHDKKDGKDSDSIVDSKGEIQRGTPSAAAAAAMATQTSAGGSDPTKVDDATLQLMIDTANLICKNDRTLGKVAFENILRQRERFNVELQWLQPGKALYCHLIRNNYCPDFNRLIIL